MEYNDNYFKTMVDDYVLISEKIKILDDLLDTSKGVTEGFRNSVNMITTQSDLDKEDRINSLKHVLTKYDLVSIKELTIKLFEFVESHKGAIDQNKGNKAEESFKSEIRSDIKEEPQYLIDELREFANNELIRNSLDKYVSVGSSGRAKYFRLNPDIRKFALGEGLISKENPTAQIIQQEVIDNTPSGTIDSYKIDIKDQLRKFINKNDLHIIIEKYENR
jgi:hypothetical protein